MTGYTDAMFPDLVSLVLLIATAGLGYLLLRTRNLLRNEINRGKKFQRAFSELKREHEHFVYVASHDLQEPVRAVEGFSQLIVRRHIDNLNSEARVFVEYVRQGGVRLRKMIFALRDYSRICTAELNPRSLDMRFLISDIATTTAGQETFDASQVSIDPLPRVVADEKQVRLLIKHVIDNAIIYADPDVPLNIQISAKRTNNLCCFSISDNGPGIPVNALDNAFEPFWQLHHDENSGAGMGLTICRQIVRRHGGEIWAEPLAGRGTRVNFTLPADE